MASLVVDLRFANVHIAFFITQDQLQNISFCPQMK